MVLVFSSCKFSCDGNFGSLVFQGVVKYNAINQLPTSSEIFIVDKSLDELKKAFNVLLDIPNVVVDEVEIDRQENYRVTLHSIEQGTHCHKCGHFIDHFYGHGEFITLRHLPVMGRQVELRLRPRRYLCTQYEELSTTSQKLGWYEPRSGCRPRLHTPLINYAMFDFFDDR